MKRENALMPICIDHNNNIPGSEPKMGNLGNSRLVSSIKDYDQLLILNSVAKEMKL